MNIYYIIYYIIDGLQVYSLLFTFQSCCNFCCYPVHASLKLMWLILCLASNWKKSVFSKAFYVRMMVMWNRSIFLPSIFLGLSPICLALHIWSPWIWAITYSLRKFRLTFANSKIYNMYICRMLLSYPPFQTAFARCRTWCF